MSLRHALLGLLADHPASGYDLTRRFEVSLQKYAWHARHSQIYPELNRLAAEGLISVVEEGARGRRTYAITEAGREEVRRWLLTPNKDAVVRNETVLRMFLLSTLDHAEIRKLLHEWIAEADAELERVCGALDRIEELRREQKDRWFGLFAAEYGRRSFQAQREWAEWALRQLDEAEQDGVERSEKENR
ncbi:transcriptional regulator, PadR family [Streptoalloteichus tenebrarius]|uniref:Transcriptional regulator, PadR family n=1 Tax=Streptoalloteichus tenebrarius (strain ATCC 17920 / DSM 40477 / JCM 4838 / CBS 697.72 / NBRC 16177 / NCIMB 11028 / NRRL B-12390 / A12253. 1 / ISP 5477) TaxID=1933 RepID=A0ABT1HZ05_STRSD|nr:PadR family transcriptional regulator [Streptoalloteichus tenebrarius]MCP2260724.1 transcriptional regulator, PadR family [Streptoalloteichus tenebrarius]BFF03742.1 helix-turn-helix transcriptional regulator [Streptoalloteichus tenebrarius]